MRIAYLIVAHKNPKLLRLFIEALSSEDAAFFIHIDRKCDIGAFRDIVGENVHFSSRRVPVYWGEYSMVEAILIILEQALATKPAYDRFVLLTGSDYPLRSREYIHRFFERYPSTEFMSLVEMPGPGKPLSRISVFRIPSDHPYLQLAVKGLARLGLARRDPKKHLGHLKPYAGSTAWALTRDACNYLLEFTKANHSVCRFFKNAAAADEILFPTILGNSPFRARITRNVLYDDWGQQSFHPEWIGEKHLRLFQSTREVNFSDMYGSGEMLFARKFSDDNLGIITAIAEMIRNKDQQAGGPS